jgi:hypothetical protein
MHHAAATLARTSSNERCFIGVEIKKERAIARNRGNSSRHSRVAEMLYHAPLT